MDIKNQISWNDFSKIDIRTGTIIKAEVFDQARKAAYKLEIDFGDLGTKKSSAQITDNYELESLMGRQVLAILNFPVKQIANFFSECLVLGSIDKEGKVILIQPERNVQNGLPIG